MQPVKRLFTIAAVLLSLQVTGQQKPIPAALRQTWSNRVSRLIPARDSFYLVPSYSPDSILAIKLIYAARQGKIPAYKVFNSQLQDKFTPNDIQHILATYDSIDVEDPVTGEKTLRVFEHKLNPSNLQHWRLLEEWTFDQSAGVLNCKIAGIAPIVRAYSDYGEYRGNTALMWFRYPDVADIIYNFGSHHKDAAVMPIAAKAITRGQVPGQNAQFFPGGFNLTIGDTTSSIPSIRPEVQYPPLPAYIARQAIQGKIKAWKMVGDDLVAMTPAETLRQLTPPDDSVLITDPVTGVEYTKVIKQDMNVDDVTQYRLHGIWTLNEKTGIFTFKIDAISPLLPANELRPGAAPAIWIKYADLLPLLNLYESRDPSINFAQALWNTLFR